MCDCRSGKLVSAGLDLVRNDASPRHPDANVNPAVAIRGDRPAVLLGRIHAAEVGHLARRRIVGDDLRIRIRAAVELVVCADRIHPDVQFGGRGLADDFDTLSGIRGVEPQDQSAVPRTEIDLVVRSDDEAPRARPFRRVVLSGLPRGGIDLDEEERRPALVEIEVEPRHLALLVRPDNRPHQARLGDGYAEILERAGEGGNRQPRREDERRQKAQHERDSLR